MPKVSGRLSLTLISTGFNSRGVSFSVFSSFKSIFIFSCSFGKLLFIFIGPKFWKYLFKSSFSSIGVTEATFTFSFGCCCCWSNFPISFIFISLGTEVFDFVKILVYWPTGSWKYLFKSSSWFCGCFTPWDSICWTLATLWIWLTGAALLVDINAVISTGPVLDTFDCWMSYLLFKPWFIFIFWFGSTKLYWANSSWDIWLFCIFCVWGFCIWYICSIWLYCWGVEEFIGTSYASPNWGDPSCSYNFWLEISCI